MRRVLIPVDGSPNCRHALRHIVNEFRRDRSIDIHLLNVQRPFSSYITGFLDKATIEAAYQEQSDQALQVARRKLDEVGIPYKVHVGRGEKADSIALHAQLLSCDCIVMSAVRRNVLARMLQNSVTNKILELTTVPVVVIAGDAASLAERYAIPAGVGTGFAWLVLAVAE